MKYVAIIGPPEEDGGCSAGVPQVPGVISEGDDFDDAVANVTEFLKEMLVYYLETNGEFPPWKPVDDFQDYIQLVEDGGDPWKRVEIEVDWKEIQEDNAAMKITRFFRSLYEFRRNEQQHEGDEQAVVS